MNCISKKANIPIALGKITKKIGSGATPKGGKEAYKNDGISLIRSMNIYDFRFDYSNLAFIDNAQAKLLNNVTVEKNDVLLNITGASVARCCMVPKHILPARVNQHVSIVRVDDSIADPRFILYCLVSPKCKDQLLSIAQGGATREALTKEKIQEFLIPYPPLPIQRKIASILSAYDDLIENNLRRIKILEEMAQNLYREWFVKFRFPGYEKVRFVDSELGKIPEGWEVNSLEKHVNVCRGRSYRSIDLNEEEGVPFINLKCIERDGGFRNLGIKKYSGKYKDTHVVRKGDIVCAVTDMTQERRIVARVAMVPTLSKEFGVYSMDLVKILPQSKMPKFFLYGLLRFSTFADEVKQFANGANVLHLSPNRIKEFRFTVPSTNLMVMFSSLFKILFEKADVLENKNQILRQTRDLLLPKLISGELDVSELDINVPEETEA